MCILLGVIRRGVMRPEPKDLGLGGCFSPNSTCELGQAQASRFHAGNIDFTRKCYAVPTGVEIAPS